VAESVRHDAAGGKKQAWVLDTAAGEDHRPRQHAAVSAIEAADLQLTYSRRRFVGDDVHNVGVEEDADVARASQLLAIALAEAGRRPDLPDAVDDAGRIDVDQRRNGVPPGLRPVFVGTQFAEAL